MKAPAARTIMPGAMYVDERVNLLDHRIVAFISQCHANNGWLAATTTEIGEAVGKSRALVNQRLVKLIEWGYVAVRGQATSRQWRVILDPSDEHVVDAVTSRSQSSGEDLTNTGEDLTIGEDITTDGEDLTNVGEHLTNRGEDLTNQGPVGEDLTSPHTPLRKKTNLGDISTRSDNLPPGLVASADATAQPKPNSGANRLLFEQLWQAMPKGSRRRSSKAKAWPQWRKACERSPPVEIVKAAGRYAQSSDVARCGGQAVDRWLRDDRFTEWLDDSALEDERDERRDVDGSGRLREYDAILDEMFGRAGVGAAGADGAADDDVPSQGGHAEGVGR